MHTRLYTHLGKALLIVLMGLIAVEVYGVGQALSGSWDMDLVIDPQQTEFNQAISLISLVKAQLVIGDWTINSTTSLNADGWSDQDFTVSGRVSIFSVSSALDLNPDATFGSWSLGARGALFGVTLGTDLVLQSSDAQLKLTMLGGSLVAFDLAVTLGELTDNTCQLGYTSTVIGIDLSFSECSALETETRFTCAGFDYFKASVSNIEVPLLPWLTLGATLEFQLSSKTLTLSSTTSFSDVSCFGVYISVDTGSGSYPTFNSITVDGIDISFVLGDVTFAGLSYWGATKPGLLSGTDYWEVYTISSSDSECCGSFSFNASTFFKENGVRLFDLSLLTAGISYQAGANLTFEMGIELDVELGAFTEWTIGFLVNW